MKCGRRGVLFVLSLIVVTLIFLLATTFVSVNRTQMEMSRDASTRQAARLAAVSGQDYARMRLESDPSWGLPTGANSAFTRSTDVAGLTVWEGETDSTVSVVGVAATTKPHSLSIFRPPPRIWWLSRQSISGRS